MIGSKIMRSEGPFEVSIRVIESNLDFGRHILRWEKEKITLILQKDYEHIKVTILELRLALVWPQKQWWYDSRWCGRAGSSADKLLMKSAYIVAN